MQLDTDFVRENFPAFQEPSLSGWAFFENAGGSFACRQVISRLTNFYQKSKVQPYAPYPASRLAGEAMDQSYAALAPYLNIEASELYLGPSTSQNVYVLAQTFLDQLGPTDEIIVTNQDHEANSGPWRRLASNGVTIREWKIDVTTARLNLDALGPLINSKTRLIAFPHCSNIVGHINPVKEICELARSVGAISVVDGVSFAGHGFPDLKDLDPDIYLFSTYKTFGPHLGAMYVRPTLAESSTNQSHFFLENDLRKKLLPAGPDHAQVAAAAGIAEYFDRIYEHHFGSDTSVEARRVGVKQLFETHESELLGRLLDYLDTRSDLRVIGPTASRERTATVALACEGRPSEWVNRLNEQRIMCWNGDFYSRRLIDALGIEPDEGVLRLSFVHYTTAEDIDHLISALDAITN